MRRALRLAGLLLAVLVGVPVLVLVVILVGANTDAGRRLIEREAPFLSGGMVRLAGLAGRFPDALRADEIEVRDTNGAWLTLHGVQLDWSPLALLRGEARIDRVAAARVDLPRLPVTMGGGGTSEGWSGGSVPLRVVVGALSVGRFELGAQVAGHAAALAMDGAAEIAGMDGSARLDLRRLDGGGTYRVRATRNPSGITAELSAQDPAGGLLATLAGLPGLGAIELSATAHGPENALAVKATLAAGDLRAEAGGTIDLPAEAGDLTVSAHAPAMTPRPDLSWQGIVLDAKVHGPFARPVAQGQLRIDQFAAAGAQIGRIAADIAGDTGQLRLNATFDAVRLPGPSPDLLAAAPLLLDAEAQLDAPDRTVTFHLTHPLLRLTGTAKTEGALSAEGTLSLPDLAPLAAAAGTQAAGQATFALRGGQADGQTKLAVDGTLGLSAGPAPLPALLGPAARLSAAATLSGADVVLDSLALDGAALDLRASGALKDQVATLDWGLDLPDLRRLAPTLAGSATLDGHAGGPLDALSATASLSGDIAAGGLPSGKVTARLEASGLPDHPAATLTAQGDLAGAPLDLSLAARQAADGGFALDIQRADWKSAHVEGALTLAKGATLPQGRLQGRMERLDDLRPLLGQALSGVVTASLDAGADRATLELTARQAGIPGASVRTATLAATVTNPTRPVIDARLSVDGAAAGEVGGSGTLTAKGDASAVALDLSAALTGLAGAPARLEGKGLLDATGRSLSLAALQAAWKGETLRLLAPARIDFADGVALERVRLGLRQAVLEASGRVSPALDLTVAVNDLPAALVSVAAPGTTAQGRINARAKLTGSPAQPAGNVDVTVQALRVTSGTGSALPPLNATLASVLQGDAARIDLRADAGRSRLAASGRVPLAAAGALDVHATGSLDLAMLDPLIAAQGRRVRGTATLDAAVMGTAGRPRAAGTLRLAGGDVQDFAQGIHLTGIGALITAQGDTLRIERFSGRAGAGTVSVSGNVGVLQPGLPLDLTVTANNARLPATDLLTATLDADLTLRGQAAGGRLAAAGKVHVREAEIRIPEKLPASIAVLDVRVPGQPPPPPPAPPPDVALDLTVDAPRRIFVRGRGLDVELGGTVHVGGTLANLQPQGSFHMIRGQLTLAGRTLTFSKGQVGFDGGALTDPTLDFVATTTSTTTTATLEVSGTASKPKITLSAVPEAPQDEVLAELLFGRSATSLSPFELAQIALALGSLTGVTPSDVDPLTGIRKGLGLDRLSVGTSAGGKPTLEAGSYVAPGIYVGARQGTAGSGTEATVQIDIAKGLKLEGTTSTGGASATGTGSAGGSSVGITYQFQY